MCPYGITATGTDVRHWRGGDIRKGTLEYCVSLCRLLRKPADSHGMPRVRSHLPRHIVRRMFVCCSSYCARAVPQWRCVSLVYVEREPTIRNSAGRPPYLELEQTGRVLSPTAALTCLELLADSANAGE